MCLDDFGNFFRGPKPKSYRRWSPLLSAVSNDIYRYGGALWLGYAHCSKSQKIRKKTCKQTVPKPGNNFKNIIEKMRNGKHGIVNMEQQMWNSEQGTVNRKQGTENSKHRTANS